MVQTNNEYLYFVGCAIVWVSLIILWILCCRLGQIITSAVLSGLVHYQVVGLNIGSGSKSCWWWRAYWVDYYCLFKIGLVGIVYLQIINCAMRGWIFNISDEDWLAGLKVCDINVDILLAHILVSSWFSNESLIKRCIIRLSCAILLSYLYLKQVNLPCYIFKFTS